MALEVHPVKRLILDRYVIREWARILLITALGFPLVVVAFGLTDNLDDHLAHHIAPKAIAIGYAYSIPENVFLALPAAVLFATVFTLGSLSRHSELTATMASGRSVWRTIVPILVAALVTSGAALALGEWAPTATMRNLQYLGQREVHSTASRFGFVYRADAGWVYAIRALDLKSNVMRDVVLEREGPGPDYPTLVVQSPTVRYDTAAHRWTLRDAHLRVLPGLTGELAFSFDSLRQRSLVETPADLLVEPKEPREMRYAELGRYIDDLERSGGDGRRLRVRQALKIAVPFTCIIIALFGAPLAVSAPKASGAFGIGVSLATTVIFLLLVQLSEAIGAGGILPPVLAAWTPNILFAAIGVVLLMRAPT
jgi:lipopolysaccharide export system permease protein